MLLEKHGASLKVSIHLKATRRMGMRRRMTEYRTHPPWATHGMKGFATVFDCYTHGVNNSPGPFGIYVNGSNNFEWFYPRQPVAGSIEEKVK